MRSRKDSNILALVTFSLCLWGITSGSASTVDIGASLQFIWNTLVKYYKEAHFGESPPGIFAIYLQCSALLQVTICAEILFERGVLYSYLILQMGSLTKRKNVVLKGCSGYRLHF